LPHSLLPSSLWTPKRREIFSWSSPIMAPIYSFRSDLEVPQTTTVVRFPQVPTDSTFNCTISNPVQLSIS
jgi:hypothetical protein